jgi:nucleoside phosphorylase
MQPSDPNVTCSLNLQPELASRATRFSSSTRSFCSWLVLKQSSNMSTNKSEDMNDIAPTQKKRRRSIGDDAGRSAAGAAERKLTRADYTVGWICALRIEHVAAQVFLDEKHQAPEDVHPNDDNDYTLGKIGRHNVVIAVLPNGEYGISSATGVAKNMLSSFPNVRIGLMVGIGGGAPSQKHDIRLGDVVVSAPCDGTGGVFQYDFGKAIQDGTFHTTGFLNQPPTFLRTAVNGLDAEYEIYGHKFEEAINGVLEKLPRLRRRYGRPLPITDKLYKSTATHPSNSDQNCAECCGNDLSNIVVRADRTEEDDNPAIHYGLIASANQVMKDARIRDTLIKEKDVLCFEMEAARLMNQFPCLVIRGICDYSDSHKSKEWQGYAAMTAAAYTKDLLSRIPIYKIEAENRIADIIQGNY